MKGLPAPARPRCAHRLVAALAPLALLAIPAAASAVDVGQPVTAGPQTPAAVAAALKAHKPVVAAFLMQGVAEDDAVLASLAEARRSEPALRNAQVFIYRVAPGGQVAFGDLATLLGIESTPAVAIIAPNGTLTNRFHGYVDGAILRQALVSANRKGGSKAASPKPKTRVKSGGPSASTTPPAGRGSADSQPGTDSSSAKAGTRGDASGIALVRKANAAIDAAPGIRFVMRGTVPGVGKARFQVTTSSRNLHLVGTLAKNGAKFEYIEFNGVHYDRDPATGCWKADPKKAVEDESFITLPGATVGKPRRTGRHLVTVRVREVDDEVTTVDYRIDTRTSFIVGARFVGGSSQTKGVVFSAHALKRAPRLVNPTTNPCPTAPAAQDPPVNS